VSNHNTQGPTNNRSGPTREDNGDEDRQFWILTTINTIIAVNSCQRLQPTTKQHKTFVTNISMKGTTYERAAVSYASLVGATWK
jgi:hypothetical protein